MIFLPYISGWGKMKHPGTSVNILQQASLKIVPKPVCHALNFKNYKIAVKYSMVCAGHGPDDKRSGCHGDSGGPLVCQEGDGSWKQQGVVSWGSGRCDTKLGYTVFSRVSHHMEWIQKNM